ncbi:MAG: trimeric intracellular cation channel family protein [Campylobacterales bacterium]
MEIFTLASTIGTVSFAISGMAAGVRKKLDLLGILIAATLTALGGGMMRDILVGHIPRALTEQTPMVTVLFSLLAAWLLRLHKRPDVEEKLLFVISDTLGLIAFAITGALVGLHAGLTLFGVLLLALVTAVGGGILRDILLNEIPLILSSEFYGSVALVVALILYLLHHFDLLTTPNVSLLFIGGVTLRLVAYFYQWQLPKL